MDDTEYVDYYAVLGLENSKDAPLTTKEISTVYRKLALKYHPDKQRVKEGKSFDEAVSKFDVIAKANDILQDEKERAKFDQKYFAKMAIRDRHKQLDEKTRIMTEELHAREKEFHKKRKEAINVAAFRKRRIKEVREKDDAFIQKWLEKQNIERRVQARMRKKHSKPNNGHNHNDEDRSNLNRFPPENRLKLSWSSRKYNFDEASLESIFKTEGDISFIRVYGKKKNRAVVEFVDERVVPKVLSRTDLIEENAKGIHIELAESNNLEEQVVTEAEDADSSFQVGNTFMDMAKPWKTSTWDEHCDFEARVLSKIRTNGTK
eukprot:CAMPEP_0204824268 /NCGR_PEP_ID=MMETSP1346-20131115/2296_1 /ASSEMBLY_ACC=CAM_ASM_000771 /TAXON_ID=215587 /ORGANISM="Aplanochytrium stocchinoi, Strain GSBS06" /LENGTH=318 /DNA_ID=CAMNT_0051951321 /DNA_START=648 /DNA_END=1604 /DNA_ORIENTATION=+